MDDKWQSCVPFAYQLFGDNCKRSLLSLELLLKGKDIFLRGMLLKNLLFTEATIKEKYYL